MLILSRARHVKNKPVRTGTGLAGSRAELHYVLWKHGLNRHMDLDAAVAGMTHDTWAVNIVNGMTKDELKSRFGYIRTLEESRPYLRLCPSLHDTVGELGVKPLGKEVVFLRDDAWMVILNNGKAVDLVLCKGY